jgi:hypothetical protein
MMDLTSGLVQFVDNVPAADAKLASLSLNAGGRSATSMLAGLQGALRISKRERQTSEDIIHPPYRYPVVHFFLFSLIGSRSGRKDFTAAQ